MTKNVTPRQRKAIESLLTQADVKAAALAAGVSRTTIYRWMKQDRFRQALAEGERQALESLSRSLVQLGETATKTLKDAMDGACSDSVKVRAANVVLSRLLQVRELIDLDQRLSRLESLLGGSENVTS
jgi:transposase-like protein